MSVIFACATGHLGGLFVDLIVGFLMLLMAVTVVIPLLFLVSISLSAALNQPSRANSRFAGSARYWSELLSRLKLVGEASLSAKEQVRKWLGLGVKANAQQLWKRYVSFISGFVAGYHRPRMVAIASMICGAWFWHHSFNFLGWITAFVGSVAFGTAPLLTAIVLEHETAASKLAPWKLSMLRLGLTMLVTLALLLQFRGPISKLIEANASDPEVKKMAKLLRGEFTVSRRCSIKLQKIREEFEYYSVENHGEYPESLSFLTLCPLDGSRYRWESPSWDRGKILFCPSSHWQKDGFSEGYPYWEGAWFMAEGKSSRHAPHKYIFLQGKESLKNSARPSDSTSRRVPRHLPK